MQDKACGLTVIEPQSLSANASGLNHITAWWFKPFPDNYNYEISYDSNPATTAVEGHNGTSFGPMASYQAYNLKEKTPYDFKLKHVRKDKPSEMSVVVSTSATTLDKCMLLTLKLVVRSNP